MATLTITISRLDYLKTPRYIGWVGNEQGGGSNLSESRTLKGMAAQLRSRFHHILDAEPLTPVKVERWADFDAADEPVRETLHTYSASTFLVKYL